MSSHLRLKTQIDSHMDRCTCTWTYRQTETDRPTSLLSVLLAVLYPAQRSEGALSLIAFPSPLIILMVFQAAQWAPARLHHIKITHTVSREKNRSCAFFLSGAPCARLTRIEHCHFTSGSDNYNTIIASSLTSNHNLIYELQLQCGHSLYNIKEVHMIALGSCKKKIVD